MRLREVRDEDLEFFFEIQADRAAAARAAVPSRDRAAFDEHWRRIRSDPRILVRTIEVDRVVAGNVLSFINECERVVGYWIGREFWGRGLASAALAEMLTIETRRPLHATVAVGNAASVRVLEKNGFRLLRQEPALSYYELL